MATKRKKKVVKKKVKKYSTGGKKKRKVRKSKTAADRLIERRLNKDPFKKAKKRKTRLA